MKSQFQRADRFIAAHVHHQRAIEEWQGAQSGQTVEAVSAISDANLFNNVGLGQPGDMIRHNDSLVLGIRACITGTIEAVRRRQLSRTDETLRGLGSYALLQEAYIIATEAQLAETPSA